jgi:tetratricopeptide repeat protein 8
MDPFFLAASKLRRKHYDECITLCDELLTKNPYDQAAWFLKCRAFTLKAYIDDLEIDEEGMADMMLDENATATVPRPGTSIQRPLTGSSGPSLAMRPMTRGGRPITGFARPGSSRPATGSNSIEAALRAQTGKPGTSRPVTSSGRYLRLGTASLLAQGSEFINAEKLDMKRMAQKPGVAKALCDYLIYCDHNPKKALELCAEATVLSEYNDWWWKARLGKCYFQLGLFREAEKQFKSSLKQQDMVPTHIELSKVYTKIDQPTLAISALKEALGTHVSSEQLILGTARVYDLINDSVESAKLYKELLQVNPCNVESIASLAAYNFYVDQPEVSLRFYRRLMQLGVSSSEIWNNLGLACFYAGQYDLTLKCLERALDLDDSNADIWYNLAQVAVGMGDVTLAGHALKVAISVDSTHAESYCNLGVLELRKGNVEQARNYYYTAIKLADYLYEPLYNAALLAYRTGDFQESFLLVNKALKIFPDHADSKELVQLLDQHLRAF